ncbi:hypothetical protein C1H46_018861 [Malus baccata]|uniref:Uncharacterized protein n=1 Tax=Malus baccata TaxID=106549 RepID=A0A540M9T6_MALBA|nr:hypothetical protein C1H46_018861 [Malus baccata]
MVVDGELDRRDGEDEVERLTRIEETDCKFGDPAIGSGVEPSRLGKVIRPKIGSGFEAMHRQRIDLDPAEALEVRFGGNLEVSRELVSGELGTGIWLLAVIRFTYNLA